MKKIDVDEPKLVLTFWMGELAYAGVIVTSYLAWTSGL